MEQEKKSGKEQKKNALEGKENGFPVFLSLIFLLGMIREILNYIAYETSNEHPIISWGSIFLFLILFFFSFGVSIKQGHKDAYMALRAFLVLGILGSAYNIAKPYLPWSSPLVLQAHLLLIFRNLMTWNYYGYPLLLMVVSAYLIAMQKQKKAI